MATSSQLKSRVDDLTTCSICLELFDIPKSLPCLHTFCLKCLEGHCRDKLPGDQTSCPLCREEFSIPPNGLEGLKSNFFVTSLVDARKVSVERSATTDKPVQCEVCAESGEELSEIRSATVYCVDCREKLCEQCSRPHRRMRTGPHKVITMGSEDEVEIVKMRGSNCEKHKNDEVRLYCFDCKENICLVCSAVEHDQHKRQEISKAATDFTNQIDADSTLLISLTSEIREALVTTGKEFEKFSVGIDGECANVEATGGEIRNIVETQVAQLLDEINSVKYETRKAYESRKEKLEFMLLGLESFSTYCSELKSKGKPCDITRAAIDLHNRATELLQTDIVPFKTYVAPSVVFMPADVNAISNRPSVGKVHTYTYSDPSRMMGYTDTQKKELNILLLGETGVGKSTWINGLINYLFYDTMAEALIGEILCLIPTSFTMTDENFEQREIKWGEVDSNEKQHAGQSATQGAKTYTFKMPDIVLRIIDTPGIGDTRGIEQDKKNMENIMSHLSQFKELHGICILLKPNNARLTVAFEFCVKELLTNLHKDACNNIVVCFTNARSTFYQPGDTMPALQKLLASNTVPIRLSKETVYCMDNEAVRFLAAVKNGVQFDATENINCEASWTKSVVEMLRLITHIGGLQPHNVEWTISRNNARKSILKLCRPIAEISKLIQDNIDVLKDKANEILSADMSIKARLEKNVIELEDEKVQLAKVSALFACFLKANAIAPYNDAVKAYLEHLIEGEKDKVSARGDRKTLEGLEKMRKVYVAEIDALEKAMWDGSSLLVDLDPRDIHIKIELLYTLPFAGPQLKQMMSVVDNCAASAAAHNEKAVEVKTESYGRENIRKGGQWLRNKIAGNQ